MADYKSYKEEKGITSMDMVVALKPYYPSMTKQIVSIVMHPELYGCQLVERAEDILVKVFGEGAGLSHPFRRKLRALFAKKDERRKKGNRITIWLPDDTYFRVLSLKTAKVYPTFQAFAEAAIVELIEKEKMRKAEIIEAEAKANEI